MEKNLDSKGRWRNKIVAFRVSPEEDAVKTQPVAEEAVVSGSTADTDVPLGV